MCRRCFSACGMFQGCAPRLGGPPPLLALSSKFGVDAARQIAAWPEWVKVGFWWVSWALNHTYVDTSEMTR